MPIYDFKSLFMEFFNLILVNGAIHPIWVQFEYKIISLIKNIIKKKKNYMNSKEQLNKEEHLERLFTF